MLEDWLRANGLEDRVEAFVTERITLADLPSLTDADLRELGLTIGERRRFRRAVLEGTAPAPPPAQQQAETLRRQMQGERRPLTVMFIDVVGSTSLGQHISDEEMLDLMRGFRALCGTAIARTGGRIAKFLGDGILAYFCYPIAHENDPHRAVRAGLEIAAKAGTIRTRSGDKLAVRVGIATGSVILGDLFDGGEPELLAATGSPLNLAARLQGCAPPGGVIVGEATHRRIGHLFVCDDLGTVELKGFSAIRCWQVREEAGGQARSEGAGPALPLRGRDAELDVLQALWRAVGSGSGRAILLRAEAGVGKSALVQQFLRQAGVPQGSVLTLAGSDLDRDTPFFPAAQSLRAAASGKAGLRGLLEAASLATRGSMEENAALLAKLAGLPFDIAPLAGLSAPQQRDRTLDAAAGALTAANRHGPVCIVVEDLHWFDPSSLDLVARLLERLQEAPLLLLMTARAGFEPPASFSTAARLTLSPLREAEVRAMAADLLGSVDMPRAVLARILERTDGVPLFVQEVVRQMRPELAGGSAGQWGETSPDVPSSLQEALMARLDQAGPAKEVAQAASTAGRLIEHAVLGAIVDLSPLALDECLTTLVDLGVLRLADTGDAYVFTHALVRDVAYSSLLRDKRQSLHGRIADALLLLDPLAGSNQPAALALHLTEAGRHEPAARCWLEAGRKALSASALTEATRLLRRGLAALEGAPSSDERTRLELELLGLLGPALMTLNGPGAPDTRAHYEHAYTLCQTLEEEPAHFPLYWGWWRVAEDFQTMRVRSNWLLARAAAHRDPGPLLQAHHCNWASAYHLGEFDRSCEHIEAGLGLYESGDWRHHLPLFGNHDAMACGHGELALVHWMQGHPEGGEPHHRRSLSWARELRHLGSLMHSMDYALVFHAMRRRHAEAYRAAEELTSVTEEHGFADHGAKGRIYRGWAKAVQDDAASGLRLLREGFARQQDIGTSEDFPIYVCLLAEALMAAGQPDAALRELLAARKQFAATGLQVWLPEVLRITAAATAAADTAAASLPLLAEAAAVATGQGVHMLGLRIANDRAATLAAVGDASAAALHLRAALGVLPPLSTPEHARARALLVRLRPDTLPKAG